LGLTATNIKPGHSSRVPEQRESKLETSDGKVGGKRADLFASSPITMFNGNAREPVRTRFLH
jgi:hypothetical protein